MSAAQQLCVYCQGGVDMNLGMRQLCNLFSAANKIDFSTRGG